MDDLKISEIIGILCKREGITKKELAERMGTTRQNLNYLLNKDNFRINEIIKIADCLGYTFNYSFDKKDAPTE